MQIEQPENNPESGMEQGAPPVAPLPLTLAVATYFPHAAKGQQGFHIIGKWTANPAHTIIKEKQKNPHDCLSPFDRAVDGRNLPTEAIHEVPPYGWINHHTLFSRLSKSRITVKNPDGKSFTHRIFFGNQKNRERVLAFFMSALEHDFSFTTNDGGEIKFSDACCYAKNKKKDGSIELFFDPNYVDSFKHLFAHKGVHGRDLLSMLEFLITHGISGNSAHAHKLATGLEMWVGQQPENHYFSTFIAPLPAGVNGANIALDASKLMQTPNVGLALEAVTRESFGR
jgi:hypothetical protein